MAKLDLASSEWCQLIFEGKNQAYGAYRMRANSPRRHTIAMLIVVAIAIVGFTIPTLLKLATPEQKGSNDRGNNFVEIGRTGNQTGRDETGRTGCTSPSCIEEFY